ncbi:hypothetical protein PR048_014365 [Dryococelus australis]|uniref:Uncharacterized protein n=1 Tax=Dryococelus australis TaxID=614101 RepID=A0ABQ9HE29_9NEOP|nr:hypothetical protein PR048_014365 [Dryococelus australis]
MAMLQRVQNEFLKIAAHVPRYIPTQELHRELQQPMLMDVVRDMAEKFCATAPESTDLLISVLGDYDPEKP